MDTTQRKLQEFNARRKLKVRVQQVQDDPLEDPLVLLDPLQHIQSFHRVLDKNLTGQWSQRSEVSCR